MLGVSGIGKTFFSNELAIRLGQPPDPPSLRVRIDGTSTSIERPRADFFQEVLSKRINRERWSAKDYLGIKRVVGVFEADAIWDQISGSMAVIFSSGLVQWSRGVLSELAATNQEDFHALLSERLVIFCTSDNPGLRGTRGRIARGSSEPSALTAKNIEARANSDLHIQRFAKVLEAQGVPVLRLNLDKPVNENVALVATFLQKNGITSPRISRWARQQSSTNPRR